MSEHSKDYLVSTSFDFGGRSISVIVEHDGFSYWTDDAAERRVIGGSGPGMQMMDAFLGSEKAREHIRRVRGEHTIQVPVPDAALKVIREDLSGRYWSDDCDQDFDLEKKLDEILEPLFWEHVNQYLSPPCSRI